MDLTIQPGNPLRGEISLPGDKSLSHRAALFSALVDGESRIRNFLDAGVTRVLLGALSALGVTWEINGTTLIVRSPGMAAWRSPEYPLDCGNSATTIRFLAGALAAAGVAATLDGSEGLRRRPMARIVTPLQAMGVPIWASSEGTAPLTLAARPAAHTLEGLDYRSPVASAQVKTAVLLAGLASSTSIRYIEPGPSRDHTERMLQSMGVKINSRPAGDLPGGVEITMEPLTQPLQPMEVDLPGDASAAAFLIVAALITPGSEICLRGVGMNPTRTGMIDVLQSMGASIEINYQEQQAGEPVGDLIVRHSSMTAVEVAGDLVVRMIDEFPAFTAAAAYAHGTTFVRQAEELRLKETDRITSVVREFSRLGLQMDENRDGFTINRGQVPRGGTVSPHGDHRLAMALSVTGLGAQGPTVVTQAEIINESFPGFVDTLQSVRPNIIVNR